MERLDAVGSETWERCRGEGEDCIFHNAIHVGDAVVRVRWTFWCEISRWYEVKVQILGDAGLCKTTSVERSKEQDA